MLYFAKISKKDKMEIVAKNDKEALLKYIERWYKDWRIDFLIEGQYID